MVVVCTVAVLVSVLFHPSLQGDLFKSSFSMETLLQSEEELVKQMEDAMTNIGNDTDVLHKKLNRYVRRYNKMAEKMDSIRDVIWHPINGYHFVRGIVLDWIVIMDVYNRTDNKQYVEIVDKMKKFREEALYPTLEDVNSVAVSICAMQRIYDLQINDLISGDIVEEATGKVFKSFLPMNGWDCLVFGRAALGQGWLNIAVEWLKVSHLMNQNGDNSAYTNLIEENLQDAIDQHDTTLLQHGPKGISWETYTTPFNEELMKHRRDQFGSPIADFHPELYTDMSRMKMKENRKRLCRGDQLREPFLDSKLVCRFLHNNDPYLLIGPFKIEEKSNDPAIIMYHDFIYDSEIERFKEIAGKNLHDSTSVYVDKNLTTANLNRVSRQYFIQYQSHPELVSQLSRRVEAATKLSTISNGVHVPLKVINYGIAGHYDVHKDFYQHPSVPNHENSLLQPDGDRIATFLMYLNEVEAGGATVFPSIGVATWPKKRSAIFWYNLQKSGVADMFTLHSGCPVLYGEKWILTQWPVADPQIFKAPCGLYECEKHTLLQ